MATAAAIAGSAVLGAISSRNASREQSRSNDRAVQAQVNSQREAQRFTREAANQARDDVTNIFGTNERNNRAAQQASLDLYNQTIPAQFEQQREGNLGAQNMLSGALPQMNNAILGGAIDYSKFQPTALPQVDTSMFNVGLPNYQYIDGTYSNPPPLVTPIVRTDQPQTYQPQDLLGGQPAQQPYQGLFDSLGGQTFEQQTGGRFGNRGFGRNIFDFGRNP